MGGVSSLHIKCRVYQRISRHKVGDWKTRYGCAIQMSTVHEHIYTIYPYDIYTPSYAILTGKHYFMRYSQSYTRNDEANDSVLVGMDRAECGAQAFDSAMSLCSVVASGKGAVLGFVTHTDTHYKWVVRGVKWYKG